MAETPDEPEKEELELDTNATPEHHRLPDGGAFIAPHGWEYIGEVFDVAAIRVWPNGDLSVLSYPTDESAAKWKRYNHRNIESVDSGRT